MLLTNGRTYALDARGTIADTLAVRDGRVAFAGRRADVNAAPGEDIVDLGGRNGDQNLWPGARLPSRATLDRVAPDHPVALVRIDGHAT
jgi:predicted amidohydrolase YtcJ